MFSRTELYGPDGDLLWSGLDESYPEENIVDGIAPEAQQAVVRDLLIPDQRPNRLPLGAIMRECERLEMLTRSGNPPGFVTVLPRGVYLDDAVEGVNRAHALRLDAVTTQFPLIFDRAHHDIAELTADYERQGRIIPVARETDRRLAYAADPGLLSWLRGRTILAQRLPYLIYSPMPAFRHRLSGETDLLTLNQYTLPDLHALCTRKDAPAVYLRLLEESAATCQLIFGETAAQFLEISPDMHGDHSEFASEAARTGRLFTIVRYLKKRTRYFSLKGGIDVHCGSAPVMIFNFQWDDVNAVRFGITTDTGEALVIVHSTLMGGWPKVLPVFAGRALMGWADKIVPVGFAPDAVVVLPVNGSFTPVASEKASRLRAMGIPAVLGEGDRRTVGSRVGQVRERWCPYVAVVGRREASGGEVRLTHTCTAESRTPAGFIDRHGAILRATGSNSRVSENSRRWDLPFQ